MIKFLHTSDWQIGMKGGGLGRAGALVAEQRIRTIERILEIAEAEDVDFVLACGDLFEHNQVADDQVTAVAHILRSHPGVEVHAIPGNHDLPGPGSVWNRAALRAVTNLQVHTTRELVELVAKNSSTPVRLYPFPVHSRYTLTDPLAAVAPVASPGVSIGLAHGHLITVTFGAHESDIKLPLDPAHVDRIGLDYLALGHWHGTRIVSERVAYSGTHEQTGYAETDAGNVLLVSISGDQALPVIRPIRVGHFEWLSRQLTFAGDVDLGRLREALEDAKENSFLAITMDGELPDALFESYREVLAEARAQYADLRVADASLRWVSSNHAMTTITDASLKEIQAQLGHELENAADEEADVIREARRLFERICDEVPS